MYHSLRQLQSIKRDQTNPCAGDGGCQTGMLCLIKPGGNDRVCECPERHYLSHDKRLCLANCTRYRPLPLILKIKHTFGAEPVCKTIITFPIASSTGLHHPLVDQGTGCRWGMGEGGGPFFLLHKACRVPDFVAIVDQL